MQIVGSTISDLKQIATRNHYDLQSLNVSDDHLAYPPGGWHHNAAGINFGLDASKPGTVAVDNIYFATDTKKMYYVYTANTWTEVTGVFADKAAAQGAVAYRGAQGWKSLPPGAPNNALLSGGASANPSWLPVRSILSSSFANVSMNSSSSLLQTLLTFSLPANVLALTGTIVMEFEWGAVSGNNNSATNIGMTFGSTGGFGFGVGNTTITGGTQKVYIRNNGATNSQNIYTRGILLDESALTSSQLLNVSTTSTEDTTGSVTVTVTAQNQNSAFGCAATLLSYIAYID